ncbi:outer membrane protein [Helicobacter sp. 16-1353]|uniref:outer membrane protein n=1 Tax=Helicobacter sp. 16-1353 TaxID=2004996 RepID=UPI00215CF76D|nr:outer membrane protein [Helicobacter sp. 16-1353]
MDENANGFYADLKLGLRANVAKNHEVEFIIKIPFADAKKTINGVEAKLKQNYSIALGCNFTF